MTSPAFSVWEESNRPLDAVEADIHDGVPLDKLHARAAGYVTEMFRLFDWVKVGQDATVVEIGPGVGYIMQSFADRTGISKVIGLDVSKGMIEHARRRVARDGLAVERFDFRHYDGTTFPFADRSVDLFYSVAAIQHVPKPFAYNIFREITRCLKPTGRAVVHLLNWDELRAVEEPFSAEIDRQVRGEPGHWHHYYDRVELSQLFRHGLKIENFVVRETDAIWVAWGGTAAPIPGQVPMRRVTESYESLLEQRDRMRASASWRATAPLRAIRRLLARKN